MEVIELVETHSSDDVSLSALAIASSSASPNSIALGPGSAAGRALTSMGKFMIKKLVMVQTHCKISSICARVREDCVAAARDASLCANLWELSR